MNEVGTFGIGSAAYWWSRLVAIEARLVMYLHYQDWVWQLIYADDFLWYISGEDPFGSKSDSHNCTSTEALPLQDVSSHP